MASFFDKAELAAVLQGFNPWWAGRGASSPAFRRLAFDACRRHLAHKELRRAILLSGPRRVGKTTILQQLAADAVTSGRDPRSVLYLSLDHPLLKLVTLREILALYAERVHPEGADTLLLLDEVQYTRDWEIEVKLLVDHRPEMRIVATGSASVVHGNKLTESGVGRWLTVPVPTLSFYEFVHMRGEEVPEIDPKLKPTQLFQRDAAFRDDLIARLRPLLPLFHRYLLVGGFPETARLDDTSLCHRLLREDVVERVLKRDMTTLFGVRNIADLERLFIYLCLHTGGILAHKTVADALGTTTATVANHLELLEQANLVYCLAPVRTGGKQVLKARNKYYLVDAALRNAVLLRSEEVLSQPDEMGLVVETTVLRHFYAYTYRDRPQIVYWRDALTHKEVDIIVRGPSYTIPIEVKYREHAALERDGGLVHYCSTERIPQAFLVTRQDADFEEVRIAGIETRFMRVPAHLLCYLLGQAERLLWE
ncbi:MAG: ATP-binding protein [Planctomycetes bacterium]|nr:ATP-binding protein [Planctomycetota bacterium]